ncbi:hypothetical protein Verru16b_00582 [Lacunisphaera limnophila]|uniref:Ice-binding protein C-terminal domain-containing protein n=1 Tax=Lacunisphaera limnophila TaxID=1838286 RepID=A0A1D8ARN2_9BACT|nr:PEP-CTERM sorting domain-containing protein [Lacunisphaera limnophila]AOS43537.1 hypothetical protein Verru16b_00582 [Lacunisphaera limnophila]
MNNRPFVSGVLRFSASLMLALAAARPATAQVTLTLETSTYVPALYTVADQNYGPSSAAGTANVSTAYGQAQATSTFGVMQLFASSAADPMGGDGDEVTTHAMARAVWTDSILVTAAGLAGTQGRLHAQFQAGGSLSLPGSVSSTFTGAQPVNVSWSLAASPNYLFGDEGQVGGVSRLDIVAGDVSELSGSANFQVYDLSIPFTFGSAFTLTITGRAESLVQPRGMTEALSAASTFNLHWLGINEVVDLGNTPLAGVTVASTGDWITTNAIPEPATYAMFAGLAALGLVAWRRRGA